MSFSLMLAIALLQMGSVEYVRYITLSESCFIGKNIHFTGTVCVLALCGLFIAGFIFSTWWVPLAGLFSGAAMALLVPASVRKPEMVYFYTLWSIPAVVMSIEAM